MNERTEIEVVMECNIKTARVNQVWAPCATSTPVRRPLVTLSNAEFISTTKRFEVPLKKNVIKDASEEKHLQENIKGSDKKKSRKISGNSCFDEDDDDEDEEDKNTSPKKNCVIKLVSSQCGNRSMKRKRPTDAVKLSPSNWRRGRGRSVKKILSKVTEGIDNNEEGNADVKSSASLKKKCTKNEKEGNVKTASKKIVLNNPLSHEMLDKGSSSYQLLDMEKAHSSEMTVGEMKNIASQKRKNQNVSVKGAAKKMKGVNESEKPLTSAQYKKKNRGNKQDKNSEKLFLNINEGEVDNVKKLSTSHEIFSDSKERELRESVNLTDVADEGLPESNSESNVSHNNFSEVKNHVMLEKSLKNRLKYVSFNEIQSSDNPEKVSRPKRTRKPPKEFWLTKSDVKKKADSQSLENINSKVDLTQVKIVSPEMKTGASYESQINVVSLNENAAISISPNNEYVKDITEMEFTEKSSGDGKEVFSTAVGWQFSVFKCCALKIGIGCEASGRTRKENNHFGGVLLKGRLLLRIHENEMKMKAGQMFHIPPLKDWKVINIGRTECVIYYWSCRL